MPTGYRNSQVYSVVRHESTMDGLVHLYPKLSIGGFIIIDDWGAVNGCKQAINDFRMRNKIKVEKRGDYQC